jgi:hypothetical protein
VPAGTNDDVRTRTRSPILNGLSIAPFTNLRMPVTDTRRARSRSRWVTCLRRGFHAAHPCGLTVELSRLLLAEKKDTTTYGKEFFMAVKSPEARRRAPSDEHPQRSPPTIPSRPCGSRRRPVCGYGMPFCSIPMSRR